MRNVGIGLALGSGSSRGWAHIGVIEALEELGIRPSVICGASIGSLVGAAYAGGRMDSLKEWVCSLTLLGMASFFDVKLSGAGFVKKEKLHHFFTRHVAAEDALIEELPVRYAAVAAELDTGRELWLTSGPVLQAVWSSIAMPGILPPVYHRDRWLMDGGLVNPVPVSICRALGAQVVIAVNLNCDLMGRPMLKATQQEKAPPNFISRITGLVRGGLGINDGGIERAPGLLESIACSINIAQDRITRSRMAGDPPDIILLPRLAHIGLLEFHRAAEAIEEGKNCVRAALSSIEHAVADPR